MLSNRLRRMVTALVAGCLAVAAATTVATAARPVPFTHQIGWDRYSLTIDGKRTFVWSGEFHPFRLPSPSEWLDVLEKMKAEGYNAVSLYFDWAYHSPAPGVYDFTGVRNMDEVLDMAAKVGLYVIARPGPYINAEVTGGGYPGWLTTQAGKARTAAVDYLAAADQWLGQIDRILQRHQLTNGTGTVILYQLENELANTGSSEQAYMQHLATTVRADGISVPLFSNDKGRNGFWVPTSSTVPGTVTGPTDLYAFDGYPGGTCHTDGTPGGPATAPDWGLYGVGGAKGGASASPQTPGYAAEFGGGWFDYWGSVGTYSCMAVREGPGYEREFYDTNIANGLTLQNFYMTFGGTSWGWLPAPVVFTSYDYGAAINEARQLRPKASTMKEIGYFLQSVAPLSKMDKGSTVTPSATKVKVYHNVNPENGTALYVAMHNPSNATTNDSFTFPIDTPDGSYPVPLTINGQDAKLLIANYDMDGQHLVYSTSEIMTHLAQADGDLALLHGRPGETGQTVLRYPSQPTVTVLSGTATSAWDATTGDLRLDYTHSGLTELRITGGGRRPLTLLLADDATADTFWRQDTAAGPVLVRGPELIRTATMRGPVLALTGDTSTGNSLEAWTPARTTVVTWNGIPVSTKPTPAGSLATERDLPDPAPVTLPTLTDWKTTSESPESDPSFVDSTWAVTDKTSTNSTTKPPAGQPVLTADDYGFHTGDVWYRGHYTVTGTAADTISLTYGGGGAGLLQVWLDGAYLGQNVLPTGVSAPPTTGTATFTIPPNLRTAGAHEISVMVRDDSHNEDGGVNDAQKEGRGLISVATTPVDAGISWRIQGNQGGEQITDPVRGALNNGGLYGERSGWSLPNYPDANWASATVPASTAPAGTSWYRTTFTLNVPRSDDASLGLTIGDPSTPRSAANYRALIFVNGWNMGQYIANVGPQHTFVVPNGVLNPHGRNTVAIAVTSGGGAGNGLESVSLTNLGTVRGGVPVALDNSPGYRPPTIRFTGRTSGTLATLSVPPDAHGTELRATVDWGHGVTTTELIDPTLTVTGAQPGRRPVSITISDAVNGTTLARRTR
jgi:beta-galactosidase GanA